MKLWMHNPSAANGDRYTSWWKMSSLEFLVVCQQGLCSLSLSRSLCAPKQSYQNFQTRIWTGIRPEKNPNKQTNKPKKFGWTSPMCSRCRGRDLPTRLGAEIIDRLSKYKYWQAPVNQTKLVQQQQQNKPKKNRKGDHCPTWYDTPAKLQWQFQNSLLHILLLLLPIHQQHRYTEPRTNLA